MISDIPEKTLPEDAYRLLVPVFDDLAPAEAERLLETAATIARGRDGALVIASLATVAPQTPVSSVDPDDELMVEARESTEEFVDIARQFDVPAAGLVRLAHDEGRTILDLIEKHACDGVLMVIDPRSSQRRRLLSGDTVEWVVSRADCEVFVEKQRAEHAPVESVLLAVSTGPHSGLATETARAIAVGTGASVDAIHVVDADANGDESESEAILDAAERVLEDASRVDTTFVEAENVATEIVVRSDDYDITVLGAPTSGLLEQFVFGTVPDSVSQGSQNAVVMAQADTGHTSMFDRWLRGDPVE